MKNLLIYPCGKESAPIIRHSKLVEDINVYYVFPESISRKPMFIDGGVSEGLPRPSKLNDILSLCDTIFMPYERELVRLENYVSSINLFLKDGKAIIIQKALAEKIEPYFEDISNKITVLDYPLIKPEGKMHQLLPIDIPVINIMGDGEQCNKFDIQLGLREYFVNKGYKVSQLGTKDYSYLFGFDPLPKFLFAPHHLSEKIINLNHYIYKKVLNEKPDVFIIGTPGGIKPISIEQPENFGEYALITAWAAQPDILIRCIYHFDYNLEFFKNDIDFCRYRFNSIPEFYHVANTGLVYPNDRYSKCEYVTIDQDTVKIQKDELPTGIQLFSTFDKEDSNNIYSKILNILECSPVTL